jgi:hypothetical protein
MQKERERLASKLEHNLAQLSERAKRASALKVPQLKEATRLSNQLLQLLQEREPEKSYNSKSSTVKMTRQLKPARKMKKTKSGFVASKHGVGLALRSKVHARSTTLPHTGRKKSKSEKETPPDEEVPSDDDDGGQPTPAGGSAMPMSSAAAMPTSSPSFSGPSATAAAAFPWMELQRYRYAHVQVRITVSFSLSF